MELVSILLPIYNERENIVPLVDSIAEVMTGAGYPFEIIAVDDASSDGSDELLRREAEKRPYFRVILFRSNTGQTAALDAGFRNAQGQIIVTMDADRQNDPGDIPRMIDKLKEGYDCVAGWRQKRYDGFWIRRAPSLLANRLIRILWQSQLRDLGCALKVYRREVTLEMRLYGEMHRFIGIVLEGNGARVAQLVVKHHPRVAGVSKYSLTRVYKVLVDLCTLWFLQRFRMKPIHVFGALGFGAWSLAALTSTIVAWQKLFEGFSINRNPLFTLSVFLVGLGFQFIVLGLIAELVIRNWFESTDRLPYSIRAKIGFPADAATPRRLHA